MKKWIRIVVFSLWMTLCLAGCVQQMDPATGEQGAFLDPEAITVIDAAAEAAPGLAAMLALLFPVLVPASAVIVGAAGMWGKMKPKLKVARTEADMYYAATESLVESINQYKADNPDAWAALREKLGNNVGENTEAVIRAIRGLPLKD